MTVPESLRQLDVRLRRVADAVQASTGRHPGADPFRGLYLSEADFRQSLNGESLAVPPIESLPLATDDSFAAIGAIYRLSQFDLDVLFLALAPEIDPRYERIFGFLQDDVSKLRHS